MRADKSDMGKPSTRSQLLHPFMTSLSDLVAQREQEIYQRFEAQLAEKDEIIAEKVRFLLAFEQSCSNCDRPVFRRMLVSY